MSSTPHKSVLLEPWLALLQDRKQSIVVDGTLGAGGHAYALLESHPEITKFIGIDQDESALSIARQRLLPWKEKIDLVHARFDQIDCVVKNQKVSSILLDIGVSSMQLDQGERGFSFQLDGPLDMRMDRSSPLTAAEIVNCYPEAEIAKIIWSFGEERHARHIARRIVSRREEKPFESSRELADLISLSIPKKFQKNIHPATLTFQALRIAVNRELEALSLVLPKAMDLLEPGGVLAIMTFHSLEDRIVKQYFQQQASDKMQTCGPAMLQGEKEPTLNILTRKPIVATEKEMKENPRSRSAKLRAVEKR